MQRSRGLVPSGHTPGVQDQPLDQRLLEPPGIDKGTQGPSLAHLDDRHCSTTVPAPTHMKGMVGSAATNFSHLEWRHCSAAAPAPSSYTGSRCPTTAPPLQPPGMAATTPLQPHFQQPGGEALPSCSPRSQPPQGEVLLHCISPAAATWNGGTASASQQPPFPATLRGGTAHLQLPATTMRGAAPLQLPYCSHLERMHCFSAAPISIAGRHCLPASPTPSHYKGRHCSAAALPLQPTGMEALLCCSPHSQRPGGMPCSAVALISTSPSPHPDWALPSPTNAGPLDSKDPVQHLQEPAMGASPQQERAWSPEAPGHQLGVA